MISFRTESELRAIVSKHLEATSFSLQLEEAQFYDYSIDQYGYSEATDQTIAVELKIRKWSRALEQALVYQLCADIVVVAMPAKSAVRADTAEFKRHGIGLLAVSTDGKCEELVKPRSSHVVRNYYRNEYVNLLKQQACPR